MMDATKSTMGGTGTVGRKAQPVELNAESPVLTIEIEIKRAATGAVERYTLTGTPVESEEEY